MADLALQGHLEIPAWLAQQHEVKLLDFNQALNSKSHKERWKYTKAQPVLDLLKLEARAPHVTINGRAVTPATTGHGSIQSPLIANLADSPEAYLALCNQHLHSLDIACSDADSALIKIELEHTHSTQPLMIKIAENTTVELIERTSTENDLHQTLWIALGAGSRLVHSRNDFANGNRWRYLKVDIGQDAHYNLQNHSTGTSLHRQDIHLRCTGPGAHAQISSAGYIPKAKHLDQQVVVEHIAPNTSSQQIFHNIAQDKAKVTFNGRIHIHPHAPGTVAHLTNKNLGVGDSATINTKPELEIYTDDVICSHGATVGQLDEQQLFYCISRGLSPLAARQLLSQAFLQQCTLGVLAEEATNNFKKLNG